MINASDLHIDDEILPLFDNTFNLNSGKAVRELLSQPLLTKEAILSRQNILKGFTGNQQILKDYSFSRFNLSEVYDFFETFSVGSLSGRKLRWKLTFSDKERSQKKGRLILMVRLFHKIHTSYLNKIDTKLFPSFYASELEGLNDFFKSFDLDRYEEAFRKNKFHVSHMVELIKVIAEKVTTGQAALFWNRWFLFEAYVSVSHSILKYDFTFPAFEDSSFSISELYHPFLKHPVKNDITATKNVILLTGPNMSGKSTLLKAVSICVYLGHTGFPVPASKATMPFFNTISVAINLTDSIVTGYSHFMSEIITLKNVLTEAGKGEKCFAVFDELFRGTNIEDALEISTATIKGLSHFPNSLFFISTHLHQLKEIEEVKTNKVSTWYIDTELKDNVPAFTYKLKEGWSDLKLGKVLFEKEGLNKMLE
jgi:DNA mismatch repair protein MutS